jgi:peroxiredoxin
MRPKEKMPKIEIDLINGARFVLDEQTPENFTILYFYRGKHCPVCKKQLEEITKCLEDFESRGVNVCAISMDNKQTAVSTESDWEIPSLPLGYGLKEDLARELGLYISTAISDKEPKQFSEPGMFIVDKNSKLYASSIQSMPFGRTKLQDTLDAIDFILTENYPPRGIA